jgi:phospholipid-binding lipoprotein MlaA
MIGRLAQIAVLSLGLGLALGGTALASEPARSPGVLERVNRWVYDLNAVGGAAVAEAAARFEGVGASGVLEPLGRALFNFVNEPVSVVSELVAGEPARAWSHVQRFAINSTLGIGGLFDRARERGLEPRVADLGLALCRRGVPAGPFVMVPVLGPRTLRDAVADIALGNLIVLAMLSPLIGPAVSVEALVAIMVLDEAAVLTVARTLDPDATAIAATDYDTLRDTYLARRAARCEGAAEPG